jgi:putative transcriptional regulator
MSRNDAMREARLRLGLSQHALAEQLGVSRQTIIAIESGDYNPTIRLCVGICRALGVTLNDLFWNSELFEKN